LEQKTAVKSSYLMGLDSYNVFSHMILNLKKITIGRSIFRFIFFLH